MKNSFLSSHFRKTKAAIEWRLGNSFYNMADKPVHDTAYTALIQGGTP